MLRSSDLSHHNPGPLGTANTHLTAPKQATEVGNRPLPEFLEEQVDGAVVTRTLAI